MGVYKDQGGDMKWSYESISTWSSDWPKEWLFSVQTSSTNAIARLKPFNGGKLYSTILRKIGCYSMWEGTHLLEMKIETNYGFKRWPSAKSKPRCAPSEPKYLD
jgi:hypothetical protein